MTISLSALMIGAGLSNAPAYAQEIPAQVSPHAAPAPASVPNTPASPPASVANTPGTPSFPVATEVPSSAPAPISIGGLEGIVLPQPDVVAPIPAPAPEAAPESPKPAPATTPVPEQAVPAPNPAPEQPAPAPAPAQEKAPEWAPPAGFVPASNMKDARPGTVASIDFTQKSGAARNALVSVAKKYDQSKPTPVIFAYGGRGDTPQNFRKYSRLLNMAAGDEAIVVYPRGIDNSWEGAPYAVTKRGEDVAFTRQILTELQGYFNVDINRVYALGMSNGGGFVANLACQAPDMLAGIVSISGAFYNPVNENCVPGMVPTLIMHGDVDRLTHYEGGLLHDAPYLSVPTLYQSIQQRNKCTEPPQVSQLPNNVEVTRGAGCAAEAVHWKIRGQGHNWWWAPDTPQVAWDFLSRQNKAKLPKPEPEVAPEVAAAPKPEAAPEPPAIPEAPAPQNAPH
ncbi:PHB depolymerase family esterase [Corynebacterium sp. sy039]|uniref:alpha/beta hydrolase family esterase n=1 Tax=Corynebacterium sp. sy039 TaxID=2599641 RepID=UPI0027380882|nr:alpha/beta hydrolase-fold protein [Corynebacterium sp. sy039]